MRVGVGRRAGNAQDADRRGRGDEFAGALLERGSAPDPPDEGEVRPVPGDGDAGQVRPVELERGDVDAVPGAPDLLLVPAHLGHHVAVQRR